MTQGRIIGPYRLGELLGRGGAGEVYEAVHQALGRSVALKLIQIDSNTENQHVLRFRREIQLSGRFNHENLVRIFDAGSIDDLYYIAMERVDGPNLEVFLRTGPLPWRQACTFGAQIARCLAYLHAEGIVHRDLKPGNVFLGSDGIVKVGDFGLVRSHSSTLLTAANAVVGTPLYLAPEQLSGEVATPATDLWGLGCILFRMLTGHDHVAEDNLRVRFQLIMEGRLQDPRQFQPALSDELVGILNELLSTQPEDRPQDAHVVEKRLLNVVATARGRERSPTGAGRTKPDAPNKADQGRTQPLPTQNRPVKKPIPGRLVVKYLLLALLVAGGFLVGRLWTRPGSVAAVATASAGGAKTASPPSHPSSLWPTWRRFYAAMPALKAGGAPARREARSLNNASALKLGEAPEAWLLWLELGDWLADPARSLVGPRFRDAQKGRIPLEEVNLIHLRLGYAITMSLDEYLKRTLLTLGEYPEDPAPWLSLAGWLERDGDSVECDIAYQQAARWLDRMNAFHFTDPLWKALIKAILLTGESSLTRSWSNLVATDSDSEKPWAQLKSTLGPARSALFQQLLDRAVATPETAEGATIFLGGEYCRQRLTRRALLLWRNYLSVQPASTSIRENLVTRLLKMGELAEAAANRTGLPESYGTCLAISRLSQPAIAFPAGIVPDFDTPEWSTLMGIDAFRSIEAGRLEPVAKFLESAQPATHFDSFLSLIPAMVAQGYASPWLTHQLDTLAQGRGGWRTHWNDLAGELSRGAGRSCWERLQQLPGPASDKVAYMQTFRAVWLSRQGRLVESVAQLPPVSQLEHSDEFWETLYAEVLSRPQWMHRIDGSAVSPLDITPEVNAILDPAIRSYLQSVQSKRWEEAAHLADVLFEGDRPWDTPIWGLSQVWLAVIHGDAATLARWQDRIRCRARYTARGYWVLREIGQLKVAGH